METPALIPRPERTLTRRDRRARRGGANAEPLGGQPAEPQDQSVDRDARVVFGVGRGDLRVEHLVLGVEHVDHRLLARLAQLAPRIVNLGGDRHRVAQQLDALAHRPQLFPGQADVLNDTARHQVAVVGRRQVVVRRRGDIGPGAKAREQVPPGLQHDRGVAAHAGGALVVVFVVELGDDVEAREVIRLRGALALARQLDLVVAARDRRVLRPGDPLGLGERRRHQRLG